MMSNPYAGGAYYPPYGQSTAAYPYGQMTGGYSFPQQQPTTLTPGSASQGSQPGQQIPTPPGQLPLEASYVENILRLNLGKTATFYMTYENNREWNAKIFTGVIEAAGRDHIIISDPQTGMRILMLMVNLDYVTFNEPLNYTYPFR